MSGENAPSGARVRIGAVSRLTGLSVHALRKWEQRYGAVEPFRTAGGERLYSREDVERLSLIRRLTAAGLPLREIARWTLAELVRGAEDVLGGAGGVAAIRAGGQPVRVGIAGESLPARLAGPLGDAPGVDLVATASDSEALAERLAGRSVDLVVLEMPTIHAASVRRARRALASCGAHRGAIVCTFGSARDIESLRDAGFDVLREPVDARSVAAAAAGMAGADVDAPERRIEPEWGPGEPVPAPRFSCETVARIAAAAPSVRCECPNHLAQLVFSLRAFEQYSAECEDANPADAELHRYLGETAGRARAAFEEALAHVARLEGIDVRPAGDG